MRRIRLYFAPNVELEFTDRDIALRQIEEIAEKGTAFPVIIYGPEGCGKTALLRQAAEILDSYGYKTLFVSPLEGKLDRALWFSPSIKDIVLQVLRTFNEPLSNLVRIAFEIEALLEKKFRRPKIALILDDLFQAVGLENAEKYVKTLLNIIEYPLEPYENIVILVSSSEGITRDRISRHNWARMYIMWNMSREGFQELYEKLPDSQQSFDNVWRWTGGNPRILRELYVAKWNIEEVLDRDIIRKRNLERFVASLSKEERNILYESVHNPDYLWKNLAEPQVQKLFQKLIELNLIIEIWDRKQYLWIDTPPPECDPELGIGKYLAWQTPLHKEGVRIILERQC